MENQEKTTANPVFCVNRKVLGQMSVCLRSLLRSGGYRHYDAYVLHSDLDESICWAMERDFREDVTFHFIPVPEGLFADFPETGRYPKQIYYRLAAPLLLPKELDTFDLVIIALLILLSQEDNDGDLAPLLTIALYFLL